MPRLPRQLKDHGCYHLIARGNNKQFLFKEEEAFLYFLDLIKRTKERYPAKLYHYCIMSNHIHLLVEIKEGLQLPKFMQSLLQGYGRWYAKRHRYTGHAWQGRYKSPLVDQESYYLEAGRYIERNPVRAKMVKDLKDYPWSSYLAYAYGRHDSLLDEDPYYSQLGSTPADRQLAYREFVSLGSPYAPILARELVEAPF